MPTLSMASADERSTWRFIGADGEPAELTHSPRLCTDDLFTLRRAALQGIGAVLVPRLLVANDLEGGALIRLLPSLKVTSESCTLFSRRGAEWFGSARAPQLALGGCPAAPELAS